MRRYAEQDFSPWLFLIAPALWAVPLSMAFGPMLMEHHHEPGVRHPVLVEMYIPLCMQVDGLPDGYCEVVEVKP